ncbi:cytochrome c biogenesis protein ResB [Geothrix fuzhouensis]|uniref:cytochrome c biogenesis protein ResB n=1 Tax=Geothrix fuzhouensis TaxID=2966451 RepID=UPI002147E5C3|nr:cytochrome c biogenesis protein ResB [Geothrix fuzhouensis]
MLRLVKRFLRHPATIIGEVLAVTGIGAFGAILPQAGTAPTMEVERLRTHGALISTLVDALALDHVFTSPAFLLALGMATVSLAIVVVEQARRLRAQWQLVPTEAHFRTAPFRREFTRPASTGAQAITHIRTRGRLALAGSPLFHIGLLCVVLAGALQALFGVQAMVDLYEGEVLPPTVEAWGAQWPGPLGEPFRLESPLRLVSVEITRYGSGDLRTLRLGLAEVTENGDQMRELGINQELSVARGRLYADNQHGPAALVEWSLPAGPPQRTAALLEKKEAAAFGAYSPGPGPLRARIRVPMPANGSRPGLAEVRILDGSATLAEGPLRPGESLPLPGGGTFKLHGLPYWARLHGNHDPAIGLAYLGFALALTGAALTYGVTRVDELVSVTPEGDQERVVVALRPHRFAPLFQERFERLVRDHGGEV